MGTLKVLKLQGVVKRCGCRHSCDVGTITNVKFPGVRLKGVGKKQLN